MSTDTITIPVTPDVANAFREASPELRRKWELIFQFKLQDIIRRPPRALEEIMNELGAEAERKGFTEEELQDILREWDEERKAARAASQPPSGSGR